MTAESDYDYRKIDALIHSRLRLAILTVLMNVEEAEFSFLRDKVNATDGNLSANLRRLEDSGIIQITKTYSGRRPITYYRITDAGRKSFTRYVEHLEQLLDR